MKFSIITPTHKRAEKLSRTVNSVLSQTYTDWEIIIVNDSPFDTDYSLFAGTINDSRIHYYVNEINRGVNYSRNFALDKVATDSDWVIFLDDDDYLSPDALATFYDLIVIHKNVKWFITNRSFPDGKPVTNFPSPNRTYSYIWDCLLLKRGRGDVTHCIQTKLLTKNHIYYSKYIKQAEEWIFYYQISLQERMYYHDHNSTITDGYDTVHGLNFRKRTKEEQLETLLKFVYEGSKLHLLHHITFLLYLCMRLVRVFIKNR